MENISTEIKVYLNFEGISNFEDHLGQLIKFIYFAGLYDVKMTDLLRDPEELKENGGDMLEVMDLFKELLGSGSG